MGSLIVIPSDPDALASSTPFVHAKEIHQRLDRAAGEPIVRVREGPHPCGPSHRFSRRPALRVGLKSGLAPVHIRVYGLSPSLMYLLSLAARGRRTSNRRETDLDWPVLYFRRGIVFRRRASVHLSHAARIPQANTKTLFSAGLCHRFARPISVSALYRSSAQTRPPPPRPIFNYAGLNSIDSRDSNSPKSMLYLRSDGVLRGIGLGGDELGGGGLLLRKR